ncbi:MAG: PKD domain-containing protein, partial [Bacteroidota bacterium]|nr:PKD domain-containing protein [Bacteroidota bacterium]
MKKMFTLLLLILTAFTFKGSAQTTNCTADFTFSVSGLSVTFTPVITTSTSTYHNYWRFDDGAISSDISPVHLYATAGTYTVTHIFYRAENGVAVCIDSVKKIVQISSTTISCNLHAGFSFERDPSQPNKISFINRSTPASDIHNTKWSFGDGTYSYDFNASHVYANPGTYTVCLIVQKDNTCQRDTCAQIQIQSPTTPICNVSAYFIWHADSIHLNKIYFGNLSSHFEAGDSIRWSFGDGSYSTDVNPTHIYSQPGTYNVCIRVQKKTTAGTTPCVKEVCKQVTILSECRIEANYNFEFDATNKNKAYFKNTSTPLTSVIYVQWNFGDGTSSNAMNPDHIYAHTGVYNVCLRISASSTCYREICKTVEINEPEINCLDISKFNLIRSTVNCLEFKFAPVNHNPNWKYHWSFGDGTGSDDMMPSHLYNHSGNYTVFLTVFKSSNCVSTSYKIAETGACFSCSNIWVKYEYSRVAGMPNKIYFHALSNYPILSQSWTITKLSVSGYTTVTLTQANPDYIFNEPGDYRVCLRAIT